jgi:hypothetical protein
MKIGIDISQTAYENTGVANYLSSLLAAMVEQDSENTYVLFYSSLRRKMPQNMVNLGLAPNVEIKEFSLPPTILDLLWNRLHQVPIETFIGNVDVFMSSDWTQPPTKNARKVTILYDLIVYKYPDETDQKIIATQKRRLQWVKRECDVVLCISESTKNDAKTILGIDEEKLKIAYPGI